MNTAVRQKKLITYDLVFETQNFPLTVNMLDGKGSPGWHRHENFHEIVLVCGGGTVHTCESHSYPLQAQELLIIAPGLHHDYGDKKFCYYNIQADLDSGILPLFDIINTEGFQRLFVLTPHSYMQPQDPVIRNILDTEDFSHAVILLKKMIYVQHTRPPGWQLSMAGCFIDFLLLICHARCKHDTSENAAARSTTIISKLAIALAQDCAQEWPISRMCKLCGMSRASLFREFQKYYHTTPLQYLTRQRLRKACILLKENDKNMEMIAADCGFDNGNYFGTVFKKHFSATPLQYRKKHQNKSKILS